MATSNRASITATGGALLLGAPLLLLIGLTVAALFLATSPSEVLRQLQDPLVREAVLLSLRTTLATVVLIVVFGTGVAFALVRTPRWLSGFLETVVTLPAIMPPSVAGIALLLAFGRLGLLGGWLDSVGLRLAFTTGAVVMAQTFVAAPFYVRELTNGLRSLDPLVLEAARLDGATPWQAAKLVVLPLAAPFAVSGAVLAWARAAGEFGATILFAGNMPGQTQTMPLAIYLGFQTDLEQAKALAVVLLLFAVGVLGLLRLLLRKHMSFAH